LNSENIITSKTKCLTEKFKQEQLQFKNKVNLNNSFNIKDLRLVSGIDLAYWDSNGKNYSVCCIVTIDYKSHKVIEMKYFSGEITVPYIPGYLSFRELPLILETFKLLENDPDLVMFDGNGYLHYNNMGIATHASFFINKPTIGVAKSYLKIENIDYIMPLDKDGAFTDITIKNEIYGRALRTHKGVKPIFVSCGNCIDLDTSTNIVLSLINQESRQPIPIRLADIETRKLREMIKSQSNDVF
jgi:deoxyribonuclease V